MAGRIRSELASVEPQAGTLMLGRTPGGRVDTDSPNLPEGEVSWQHVKVALTNLGSPLALSRSSLAALPCISRNGSAAVELRALLVDVVVDLSAAPAPKDAEAGCLLLDYYVKRVGTHEVVMERLHLSRPTFYRRLNRGFTLAAQRLNELNEFISWFGCQQAPVRGGDLRLTLSTARQVHDPLSTEAERGARIGQLERIDSR